MSCPLTLSRFAYLLLGILVAHQVAGDALEECGGAEDNECGNSLLLRGAHISEDRIQLVEDAQLLRGDTHTTENNLLDLARIVVAGEEKITNATKVVLASIVTEVTKIINDAATPCATTPQAATTTTTTQAQSWTYKAMATNTNTCENGWDQILDEQTCEQAAASVGLTFNPGVRNWDNDPKGCFITDVSNNPRVYINGHSTGNNVANRAPLCKQAATAATTTTTTQAQSWTYKAMDTNTNTCENGWDQILDEQTCEQAAASVGLTFNPGVRDWDNDPKGCFITDVSNNPRVYINGHSTGNNVANRAPICKQA